MNLLLTYTDSSGKNTERQVSKVELVKNPEVERFSLRGYCHLRQAEREFRLDRIKSAIVFETGEVIEDLYAYFEVPRPVSKTEMDDAKYRIRPGKSYSIEELQSIRKYQKQKFMLRFAGIQAIEDLYKARFAEIFKYCCFQCNRKGALAYSTPYPKKLTIDHHIPLILGGLFEEGNLVLFCRSCNSAKHDTHPEIFYDRKQLKKIKPLLSKQIGIFDFRLDREKWQSDRSNYLAEIGVSNETIDQMLYDPDHVYYVGLPEKRNIVRLTANGYEAMSEEELGRRGVAER